jgi:hypothetical protein
MTTIYAFGNIGATALLLLRLQLQLINNHPLSVHLHHLQEEGILLSFVVRTKQYFWTW